MKDAGSPKALVPTMLVFGVTAIIPVQSGYLLGQVERMKSMRSARGKLSKEIAGQRLSTATISKVPSATNNELHIGSEVLFYKERPTNNWVGPYRILDVKYKVEWVNIDGRISQCSVDKVKPYLQDYAISPPSQNTHGHTRGTSDNTIQNISPSQASDKWLGTMCHPLHDLCTSPANVDTLSPEKLLVTRDVFMTQIIELSDPRASGEALTMTKNTYVEGLERRGVWKKVFKNSLLPSPNVLSGRFVPTLKKSGTNEETPKARFVAQGSSDRDKHCIIHNFNLSAANFCPHHCVLCSIGRVSYLQP